MNYQIQGLSIHAEVHGTAEPALVFLQDREAGATASCLRVLDELGTGSR
jgi:hypothetical protein